MVYDPKSYWEKRGKKYKHPEHIDELENLFNFIAPFHNINILDVGAGDGRVYLYLKEKGLSISKDNFVMCDFSDSFRYICQKNTGILPESWDGKTLPYKDNSFDMVLSFSVCLHVLPSLIDNFIKEHTRVSKKYLFIATWYENGKGKNGAVAEHCFEHDYYNLFNINKLKIIKEIECYKVNNSYVRRNWFLEKT